MQVCADLPAAGRDFRLDLFRGLANWAIFLDHIRHEVLNWITIKNYGFSDAADLFVFISGYTVAFVFGRVMIERGLSCRRIETGQARFVALCRAHPCGRGLCRRYRRRRTRDARRQRSKRVQRRRFHYQGRFGNSFRRWALRYRPVNPDVLPALYILLLGTFAPALWLMIRKPMLILGCSIAVYLAGRHFGWNLSSSRSAVWYFNPFAWQLLFFLGVWVALGGSAAVQSIVRTRTVFWLAIAYLVFALVVTMPINSFCAHAAIEASLNSLWVQIFVGTLGVLLMTAVAYYGTWPKRRYPILPSPGSNWQNAVPSKSV
jgi:hypothetical protein